MIAHLCAGTNIRDAKCVAAVCWQAKIFVILDFVWVSITMLTDHTFHTSFTTCGLKSIKRIVDSLALAGHH